MSDLYGIQLKSIDGIQTDLSEYRDMVMLIVNTASKCSFTKQYEELEDLYRKYKDQGFVVLGFPCNQFLNQEPGDENQIKQFCSINFNVTFPMFAKIEVNGKNTHPLFAELKKRAPGFLWTKSIKWNFTKFLVSPNAESIKRFSPVTSPSAIEPYIEKLLTQR